MFENQNPRVRQICKQEVGRWGRKHLEWKSVLLWQDWVMGIILFKSSLAVSVLHCRNNHIGNTKLIPEKRDQERKQRDNKDRNWTLRNEINFEECVFKERETNRVEIQQRVQERWTQKQEAGEYLHGKSEQINLILNEHSL